jgi:hypothetical protein
VETFKQALKFWQRGREGEEIAIGDFSSLPSPLFIKLSISEAFKLRSGEDQPGLLDGR